MAIDITKIKELKREVEPYAKSSTGRSVWQLINTIVPLFVLWALGFYLSTISAVAAIAVSIVAACFIVRTFIIFHDCTHGSFFRNGIANSAVGFVTGVLTTFPFEKWKREHTIHHANSGNLDKRGIGDIDMMTLEEYKAASKKERALYRFQRNPLVMFLLGPLYLMIVVGRWNRSDARVKERVNTYLTTAAIALVWGLLVYFFGVFAFLQVMLVSVFVASMLGIWLFYIQHTYEDAYFENETEWDYVKAAIEGSSFFKLPKLLQWISGNIGFHHVHHLAPRIPNYHLEKVHQSVVPLQKGVTTITFWESLKCFNYKVYDVEKQKFLTFRQLKSKLRA